MADGFDFHNDVFVLTVIRRRVLLLIRAPFFNESEVDDLVQEVHLRLMRSIQSYDPALGHPYPFLCTAIQRITSKIFRERSTHKRQQIGTCSLSEVVHGADGESCELYQLLRQEDQDRRICRKTARSDEERANLRMDLSRVIEELPPICQKIVRLVAIFSPFFWFLQLLRRFGIFCIFARVGHPLFSKERFVLSVLLGSL